MNFKSLIVGAILTLFAFTAQAQENLKIGFVDTDYILTQMPEAKQIQSELQAYQRQLSDTIAHLNAEVKERERQRKLKEGVERIIRHDLRNPISASAAMSAWAYARMNACTI